MTESIGVLANWACDPSTIDTSSEPYEFLSESLRRTTQMLDTNGIRGERQHAQERTRFGQNICSGTISTVISPADLDNWLPRILGGTESLDVFGLTNTLPSFNSMIDRVSDAYLYSGCKINRATFSGSAGGFIQMDLDIIALSETAGQTFPALTLGVTDAHLPYVFTDSTLTLVAAGRAYRSFQLTVSNFLEVQFNNSRDATEINATDLEIALNVDMASDATNVGDLLAQSRAGATGALVWTNGTVSTTWTFGTLQPNDQTPVVAGKGRIPLNIAMIARKTGTTPALSVTNDSAV
jgi:hypothetical protein